MSGVVARLSAALPDRYSYPPERDPLFDSLRFLAVAQIVVFHFVIEVGSPDGLISRGFFATWAMRVPLLVFVSGWFSSAEPPTKRSIVRLLQSVVVVYLIFDLLQRVQIFMLVGNLRLDFDEPIFGMWFLLSLATWRVLLPYLVRIRWFGLIAAAFAVVGGLSGADKSFSAGHTIALLPIFLLGWYVRHAGLKERLRATSVRIAAVLVVIASVAAGWFVYGTVDRRMVGMHGGYRSTLFEFAWRPGLLLWAAATVLALFALVPGRRIPLVTACGSGSMFAYVLHQLIQRQWLNGGGPDMVNSWAGALWLGLAALALAVVLMLPGFRRYLRPLVQPRWKWFLRDREPISDVRFR